MPIYEYKCLECGAITEELRPIKSRDDIKNCGTCGASAERILSTLNTVGTVTSKEPKKTFNTDRVGKPRGTAIRLRGGSATLKDCSFRNLQTGISVAKGTKLSMNGSKFENVERPIEVTDE